MVSQEVKKTNFHLVPGVLALRAFALTVFAAYFVFDGASGERTRIMLIGAALYLVFYGIVLKTFNFVEDISYKRLMSLTLSVIISGLSTYAIYFEEDNQGRSLVSGYQSKYASLAINLEIGAYIADILTIIKAQYDIKPLLVHHVCGIAFFSYASLHRISSLMICYGLLQEACNPFWYANQLMYTARKYRDPSWQPLYFFNAFLTLATYIIIRFVIVLPNSFLSLYLTFADCPDCIPFDSLYALICTVTLLGVNSFNVKKLALAVWKALDEARFPEKVAAAEARAKEAEGKGKGKVEGGRSKKD